MTTLTTEDGNPATPYDPGFRPFIATPAHPEYGHAGYAGAAEAVFRALVGLRPARPITITSSASPTVCRTYDDWGQPTQENVDARVWEGIHLFGRAVAQAAPKAAGD